MAPPELPLEAQEHVLDHLHDDLKTLKSCSFVCRAWTRTTRLHLLGTIVLNTRCNAIRFLSLLEESDRIGTGVASCVRELELPILGFPRRGKRSEMRCELLSSISRRLPVVEVLCVRRFNITALMDYLHSDDEAFNMQDALSSIFVFPHLKAIHYHGLEVMGINELLEFLGAFPTVSSLHAHNIDSRWDEPWPLETTAIQNFVAKRQQAPISIEDIMGDLFSRSDELRKLLAALAVPPFELRLKRLGWTINGTSGWLPLLPMLLPVFRRANATLEYLELAFNANDVWLERLDLSNHRRLKSVSLTFRFTPEKHHQWPRVPVFLSRITSTDLQVVDLHFHSSKQPFLWEFFDWSALSDAFIALRRKCPRMTVTFYFYIDAGHGVVIPGAIDPLRVRIAPVLATGMRVVVDRRIVTKQVGLFADRWIPIQSERGLLEA
ncbi:uncharacterized protein B0H18DRAFT_1070414 [Fomitopsis serialis]|uniref:uncharacterized protein n=1 Tax=Fomitopsis serialis TaxID=139415 RepID=UPI002008CD1D|nr:uncharacterized protein B0H18DRAFT_1070414 [Neoantrodia serialis]KAH9910386.1 hypothetical protein B0H18DRAFT_1070414 [Neoantrodia serialis]